MIFYGINPVLEARRSDRLPQTIYVAKGKNNPGINSITHLAKAKNVPVHRKDDIRKICASNEHQGVCAEITTIGVTNLFATDSMPMRFVVLDSLQDPHNFGAALRVCEVFGFKDVIFHKGNSCGVTAAAIKASAGALFHINLYTANLNSAIKGLKAQGYSIVALDCEGEQCLFDFSMPEKFCLVMGSESKGVRFSILRQADSIIKIPMFGKINSLNVSCALSAVLHECVRKTQFDKT